MSDYDPKAPGVKLAVAGARSGTQASLRRQPGGHEVRDLLFRVALVLAVSLALLGLALILIDAFLEGRGSLSLDLITNSNSSDASKAGFQQAIIGTIYLIA